MKQRSILMSAPMVQAILEGRKTQTRRAVKVGVPLGNWEETLKKCPYGQPGDLLWVRETFRRYYHVDEHGYTRFDKEIFEFAADNPPMIYQMDGDGCIEYNKDGSEKFIPWKPSIHMKKERARIWLQVTDIRVERLNDISEQDAICEGVQENICDDPSKCPSSSKEEFGCCGKGQYLHYSNPMDFDLEPCESAAESFKTLWESINGPESWQSNPWVWVVSFKVLSTTGLPAELQSTVNNNQQ